MALQVLGLVTPYRDNIHHSTHSNFQRVYQKYRKYYIAIKRTAIFDILTQFNLLPALASVTSHILTNVNKFYIAINGRCLEMYQWQNIESTIG